MVFRNNLKFGLIGSVAGAALLFGACGGDDDGGGGGGAGNDEDFVAAICAAGRDFSEDFAKVIEENADLTETDEIAEVIVEPFENFANAVEDANPPEDLEEWHGEVVSSLNNIVENLKSGNEDDILAALDADPISDPPADAVSRLEAIAEDNEDCQEADFTFGE